MEYRYLSVEKSAGLTTITLMRPQVMNALSPDLLRELKAAVMACGRDDETGVVAITGSGKAFSAGADLNSLQVETLKDGRVGAEIDQAANAVIEALIELPKVVIAAVNGHCYTGALEIVLGCDLAVAAESARFGDTHVRFGIRPSWGMSQRLPRRIGLLKARELSFTARTITAQEAEKIGLVNKVVADERLKSEVAAVARSILENSLAAVGAYKKLFNAGAATTLAEGLKYEAESEFAISDTRARIEAFMRKK